MNKYFSFLVVGIFILFFLSLRSFYTEPLANVHGVEIAGRNIKVDFVNTKEAQARGLSGRSGLKEDEGMLFVFNKNGIYTFWMKDMNFPIDIIWIGQDMKVAYIKKDARPELYPEAYGAGIYARYVLEVSSGFSEKNNLKEGDTVKFMY